MSPEPQHSNGNGSVTFEKVRQTEQETIQAAFGKVDDQALVGLAFSGGGIRSATFGLGVLEHVDNFTRHTESLIGLWDKLQKSPELRPLDRGLFGATVASAVVDGTRLRLYTCLEMLQLMENVYIDLHLDDTWDHADNSGWRALFQKWAALDEVQSAWKETSHFFGVRFGYFCERHLNLPRVDGQA